MHPEVQASTWENHTPAMHAYQGGTQAGLGTAATQSSSRKVPGRIWKGITSPGVSLTRPFFPLAFGVPAAMRLPRARSQVQQKSAGTGGRKKQPLSTPLWARILRAPRGPRHPPHAEVMLCVCAPVFVFSESVNANTYTLLLPPPDGPADRLCGSKLTVSGRAGTFIYETFYLQFMTGPSIVAFFKRASFLQ